MHCKFSSSPKSRQLRIIVALASLLGIFSGAQTLTDPAALVDPMIGTANTGFTFPGAVIPFGMVSFSPEQLPPLKWNIPGGYLYSGTTIRGFSLTHISGAGCAGSGDFMFMPLTHGVTDSPATDTRSEKYVSDFSHAQEHAEAGFYSVVLSNGVGTKLTATTRTGSANFTYPAGHEAVLLIRSADNEVGSTDSHVTIDPAKQTVTGSLTSGDFCWSGGPPRNKPYYTIYFSAHFDQPFKSHGTWQDADVRPNSTAAEGGTSMVNQHSSAYSVPGKGSGAYVSFDNASGITVGMRIGISYVSVDNAEQNLRAENGDGMSLDTVRAQAHEAWTKALSLISIKGGTREDQVKFYTALYHSLLQMNIASDVNGQYRGLDLNVHTIKPQQHAQYANFSGWDVYRSQMQLVTLLLPDVGSDMAQSLLNQADQYSCWSRWTHNSGATEVMNGDPSAPAIADVYAFGGRSFDAEAAYQSLLRAATAADEKGGCSRRGIQQLETLHYLAPGSRQDTSVADTLEYATADFTLAQLADFLGHRETHDTFLSRAQYWKNLFNPHALPGAAPDEGYLQSRNADGTWRSNFDPASEVGFVEGTGAQYLWMVPFNEASLFRLIGGNQAACRRLNGFFQKSDGTWALNANKTHPRMDNEPSIGTPWLYNYCGEPFRTQNTVAVVRNTLWNTQPRGIPGNDDLGEMSSWFVWSALGMYPEIPGRAELLLTSPLFDQAVIHRKQGDIIIDVSRKSPSAIYIQRMLRNGRLWRDSWLPPSFLDGPQRLSFSLAERPEPQWGVDHATAPPSFDH
ncbi:MAG: GH92 family glycosyl hydrolase [Acidobacteriaceae bacterium]|nr:GH92 family glycosyl hydrolase [Acidobacteriaceae bacterium]